MWGELAPGQIQPDLFISTGKREGRGPSGTASTEHSPSTRRPRRPGRPGKARREYENRVNYRPATAGP
ncbi:resolvase domain protein [Streptomyces azureus]|uniref:Resolvase domain protein n=2 Tax=Streptomyces azureus TaxID=146537 RepID=A0A0K8PNU4_STRAJ|nr:resolvase domain protein [Streptomyces azureus]